MKSLVLVTLAMLSQFAAAELNRACFYADINYKGQAFCLDPGKSSADLSGAGWSKRISSVLIEGTGQATLYNSPGFKGGAHIINSSEPDLRQSGWNDAASSLKVIGVAGRACFYKDINYGGAYLCVFPHRQIDNLAKSGWNDLLSSAKIVGDASAYLWESKSFTGPLLELHHSESDFRKFRGWNDVASSLKVLSANEHP